MTTKVKLAPLDLENPGWSVAEAKPGDQVELTVTAKALVAGQTVEFQVRDDHTMIAVVKPTAAGDKQKAKWIVPNFPGETKLTFDAVIRETPSPKNGHITSRGRVTSPGLAVHGFKVSITTVDAAFVPGKENLHVQLKVENKGGVALKGRYEIWGERCLGNPIFADKFTPAAGDTTWSGWDSKANGGALSGKLITPEFSPYRVRVIIGLDDASVKDPAGVGKGKVCVAEHLFEVVIESLQMRLQSGLSAAVTSALNTFLAIEPRDAKGVYHAQGRLPEPGETCRMRVPTATHSLIPDTLSQGGDPVGGGYLDAKTGSKWTNDATLYTRAELPIEFEPRLRSRDPANNKAPKHGVFSKEAVGALNIEAFADDHYDASVFAGGGISATYWKNAVHKVKRGTHNAPAKSGGKPIVGYWQARIRIAKDGDRTIDLHAIDPDFKYVTGKTELTIYLNRARLTIGAVGAAYIDVEETDATHVKLRAKLTRKDDIVWIVRSDSGVKGAGAPNEITTWSNFPPGNNCHVVYGGLRGGAPFDLLRKDFSADPAPPAPGKAARQPILGKGTAWLYAAKANDDPDGAGNARERAETQALDSGANQGLAGIIFSPSYVAGDSYVLGGALAPVPYERTLGYFSDRPPVRVKSGICTVWRLATIKASWRAPDPGTKGYPLGVGCAVETATNSRAYRGDGVNMDMAGMNAELTEAFNEWQIPAVVAPATDVHQDIPFAAYIAAHDGSAAGGAGQVTIGVKANITNQFVQFEHFRVFMPPGIPPGDRAAVATALAALPVPTLSTAAMAAAAGVLGGPAGGAPAIPMYAGGGGAMGYFWWMTGINLAIAGAILDAITPQAAPLAPGPPPVPAPPPVMNVVRWDDFYQMTTWFKGTPSGGTYNLAANATTIHITGYCRGNGQSYFSTSTVTGDPTTFGHEMGHSLQLSHFAGGNFCWKHHHLLSPDCRMSYNYTHGYILQPVGAAGPVGGAATEDTGWPDTIPQDLLGNLAIPLGSPTPVPAPLPGARTIDITVLPKGARAVALPIGHICAKCALKIRGWKDEPLPVAWKHPDLF
ncbi:MAG: hypothetical protein ABJE95_21680 [Byssovorax sp.]